MSSLCSSQNTLFLNYHFIFENYIWLKKCLIFIFFTGEVQTIPTKSFPFRHFCLQQDFRAVQIPFNPSPALCIVGGWRFNRSCAKAPVDLDVSSECRHFHVTKLALIPDSTETTLRPQYPSSLPVLPCHSFLLQINSYYSVRNAALNRGGPIFAVPPVTSSTYSPVFPLAVNKWPCHQKEALWLTMHPVTQTGSKLQNWFLAAEVIDS